MTKAVLYNWTHSTFATCLQRSRWIWTLPLPPPPLRTPRPPLRPPTRSPRAARAAPPAPLSRRRRSGAAAPPRADRPPRHSRCVSRVMLRAWGGVDMCLLSHLTCDLQAACELSALHSGDATAILCRTVGLGVQLIRGRLPAPVLNVLTAAFCHAHVRRAACAWRCFDAD